MSVLLYLAKIPNSQVLDDISIPFKSEQIKNTANLELKKQRYFAFKLLEVGLWDGYRQKLGDTMLRLSPQGKMLADNICLSVSHTDDYVCVAISNRGVGVDIEWKNKMRKINAGRVFTDNEKQVLEKLSPQEKLEYYITKWTQKESIFKSLDKAVFSPNKIETSNFCVKSFCLNNEPLIISVCGDANFFIQAKLFDFESKSFSLISNNLCVLDY